MIEIIEKHLGQIGSVITFSKSNYRIKHPNNIVIFNCNIIIEGKKIWYGDIDVTLFKRDLLDISKEINKDIYLLYEMDARFDKELNPNLHNFAVKFEPNNNIQLHKRLSDYYIL